MRRVRLLLFVLLLLIGVAPRAAAQVRASVSIVLDSAGRKPVIQLSNLFEEKEWREAVDEGIALRLMWHLTQWRKGGILGDNEVMHADWTDVVQRQPLLDQYSFSRIYPDRPLEARGPYPRLDVLNIEMFGRPLTPNFPVPTLRGEYYYSLELTLETMNGEDFDNMSRFQGQNPATLWASLTRVVGRLFLPGKKLPPARTPTFRIP